MTILSYTVPDCIQKQLLQENLELSLAAVRHPIAKTPCHWKYYCYCYSRFVVVVVLMNVLIQVKTIIQLQLVVAVEVLLVVVLVLCVIQLLLVVTMTAWILVARKTQVV